MDTRINGNLKAWNEPKGFGFITPLNGGQDIFVHVSDYPKQGGFPKVGEPISFEVALGKDGKKKAVRVLRPRGAAKSYKAGNRGHMRRGNSMFDRLIGVALIALIIFAGYRFLAPKVNTSFSEPAFQASIATPSGTPVPVAARGSFTCDGRTHCSQMTSCAEATYFIRNCPNTEMDGDGDGVPCESQWCTSPFAK